MIRRPKIERHHARRQREPERADHLCRPDPRAARRERRHVALRVHGIDVHRARPPGLRREALLGGQQGGIVPGVARTQLFACLSHINQICPGFCIGLGQQYLGRNHCFRRIAVVLLAIGKGELGGLDQEVQVIGAARPHRAQVEAPHDGERLQHRRPLRPEAALVDRRLAEAQADGRLDPGLETLQVGALEQPAALPGEARDLRSDLASVERFVGVLCIREVVVRSCERLILHQRADFRDRHVKDLACRPGLELVAQIPETIFLLVDQALRCRKSVACQLDRRRDRFAQRHRAVALERGEQRAERGGNAGRENVLVRHVIEAAAAEFLRRGARRRRHVAVEHYHLVAPLTAQQDRAFAADGMHLRVHQPFDEAGCNRRVDRVAARLQHVDAGVDRKIGIAGHRAVPADEARVERRRVGWRATISSRGHADARFSRRTEDRRSRFARRVGRPAGALRGRRGRGRCRSAREGPEEACLASHAD